MSTRHDDKARLGNCICRWWETMDTDWGDGSFYQPWAHLRGGFLGSLPKVQQELREFRSPKLQIWSLGAVLARFQTAPFQRQQNCKTLGSTISPNLKIVQGHSSLLQLLFDHVFQTGETGYDSYYFTIYNAIKPTKKI